MYSTKSKIFLNNLKLCCKKFQYICLNYKDYSDLICYYNFFDTLYACDVYTFSPEKLNGAIKVSNDNEKWSPEFNLNDKNLKKILKYPSLW